jgi:hypothetical protein
MKIFWILFLALLFLHQDIWNWSSEEMVLGGVPIGLFYHALFSLACSGLGAWAVLRAWPSDWEQYAENEGKPREQGMKTDLQDR